MNEPESNNPEPNNPESNNPESIKIEFDTDNKGNITFKLEQFSASKKLPKGLVRPKLIAYRDFESLILDFSAFVLRRDAGPIQRNITIYNEAIFPWYIPKFLRKRWSRKRAITLEVTPTYIYPEVSVTLPELGIYIPSSEVHLFSDEKEPNE